MTDSAQQVIVIIVSFNSAEIITQCLGHFIDNTRYETVIVDNGSTDNSAITLKQRFKNASVISLDHNIGYGNAANHALRQATTPYALLINPDISTTDKDIDTLIRILSSHQNALLVAPSTHDYEHSEDRLLEKEWVLGAAMLFNMSLIRKLNYFDENIFLYYEEKDLCYRARKHGYQVLQHTGTYFPHLKGQSTTNSKEIFYLRQWHVAWSSAYYFNKHGLDSGKNSSKYMFCRYLIKSVFSTTARKRLKYKARCNGILSFLHGEAAFTADDKPQAYFL